MKIPSIHGRLVRQLSISITAVTILILLLTDVAIDTWVHDEFDRAMHNKAHLLSSLVDEDIEGIEFDFAGEFMPEFEGKGDPEYYQLWRGDIVFERSKTLDMFNIKQLEYIDLPIGKERVVEMTLPDGRSGQVLYYRFIPQVDSDKRPAFMKMSADTGIQRQPVLLAYAMSNEKLTFLTLLIDISFFVSAFIVIFMVRFLVKRTVNSSLKPLDDFTKQLKEISLANKQSELLLSHPLLELMPIQDSVNAFLQENRTLYEKEQRLTSDIAHELKTPISELISLTEVSLKFPDDKKLSETYQTDVLEISQRLQNIVANILLFHRYNKQAFEKNDIFDPQQVITRLMTDNARISLINISEVEPITSSLFAFEIIVSNLLKNALTYSPSSSSITVSLANSNDNSLVMKVSNTCIDTLNADDIQQLFDPLWQKDKARTSTSNFGLGLSIVKTFTSALDGEVSVNAQGKQITFSVVIPA